VVDVHKEDFLKFRRRSYRCGAADFESGLVTVADLEKLRITDLVVPLEQAPAQLGVLKEHFQVHLEIDVSKSLVVLNSLGPIDDQFDELHLLGLETDPDPLSLLSSLGDRYGSRLFVGIQTKGRLLDVLGFIRKLIKGNYQIFLEPSLKSEGGSAGWTIFQIRTLMMLAYIFAGICVDRNWGRLPLASETPKEVWPLTGWDQKTIWDNLHERKPFVSIVIPVRQQREGYILEVLQQLGNLAESESVEVIVVDDGSESSILARILRGPLNIKSFGRLVVISWMRAGNVDLFRAGQARNLGASVASSELLFFLDGDILVPSDLVGHVREAFLDGVDVLQFVRCHVSPEVSRQRPAYQDVRARDISIEESSYWRPFFECTNWMNLKNYWKYTCTYSLVIRAQDFWSAGGFSENFLTYGFEDTQLGYRLAALGKNFRLSQIRVYHLSDELKGRLSKALAIRKSARVFFLNQMEPRLFRTFKFLMVEFPKWILRQRSS
jgi:glycosyltransferase involved in cell wall biosynthesis